MCIRDAILRILCISNRCLKSIYNLEECRKDAYLESLSTSYLKILISSRIFFI